MDEDHLRRLRYETGAWNAWRQAHLHVRPDLGGAVLNSLAAKSTLASNRSVFRAFQERDFSGIDLHGADLQGAKIWTSDLSGGDFRGADLGGAEFRGATLRGADLREANLQGTQFLVCDLRDTGLEGAVLGRTHFGFTRLAKARGLEAVRHLEQSQMDQFSVIHSMPLPAAFLHACEVPEHVVRMAEAYALRRACLTCFISYSRRDEPFAAYLREALTWAGVPSWFAPQDMRSEELQGAPVELERDLYSYVDEAERTLLLVSPSILASAWVGKEFQRARGRSQVLPVLLESMPSPGSDDWLRRIAATVPAGTYSQLNPQWYSAELQRLLQEPFVDFRGWRDPRVFSQAFFSLLPLLLRSA